MTTSNPISKDNALHDVSAKLEASLIRVASSAALVMAAAARTALMEVTGEFPSYTAGRRWAGTDGKS